MGGIHTRADVQRVLNAGVDAVLVGEAFMNSRNLAETYRQLFG